MSSIGQTAWHNMRVRLQIRCQPNMCCLEWQRGQGCHQIRTRSLKFELFKNKCVDISNYSCSYFLNSTLLFKRKYTWIAGGISESKSPLNPVPARAILEAVDTSVAFLSPCVTKSVHVETWTRCLNVWYYPVNNRSPVKLSKFY